MGLSRENLIMSEELLGHNVVPYDHSKKKHARHEKKKKKKDRIKERSREFIII
jgi:hypothetical protein